MQNFILGGKFHFLLVLLNNIAFGWFNKKVKFSSNIILELFGYAFPKMEKLHAK